MVFLQQVRKMPFLRIVIPYLTGLIAGYSFLPLVALSSLIGACVALVVLLFTLITLKTVRYSQSWFSGILASLVLFLLGFVNIHAHAYIKDRYAMNPEVQMSRLIIMDSPEIKSGSVRALARIRHLYTKQGQKWLLTNAILTFSRTALSESIRPGDIILLKGRFLPVPGPANPGEFDYSRILSRQDIEYQIYADSASWTLAGHENRSLRITAVRCRDNLLARFHASPLDMQTAAVLSALTLGYKSDMEAETTELFTRAGVIHVMALSGFNVGIVFLIINFCMGFLRKRGIQGFIRLILSLAAVWTFVVVTGLSSSVTRAGIMISLFLTGKYISRDVSPMNIVSASAFLMLVVSPFSMLDVGFQLSFAAVLGIIYVQPYLYRLIQLKNTISDKIWILFTVSIAAQLTTAPLTLYYFHMFPLFFWITNLYVVPLVTLIIYLCIPFLLFSFITPVTVLLAKILEFLVHVLTGPLDLLTDFPMAVVDGIFLYKIQVILLYAILIIAFVSFRQKSIRYGFAILVLIMVCIVPDSIRLVGIRRQKILTVNSIKGATLLNILSGKNNLVMSFSGPPPDKRMLHFSFYNWWVEHGVEGSAEIRTSEQLTRMVKTFRDNEELSIQDGIIGKNVFLNFSGITMVVCNDDIFDAVEGDLKLKTDYIVITKTIRPDIRKLLKHFEPGTIIIDSSVGYYESVKWTALCRESKVDCWPVREKGAFMLKVR
jgi:competence protein ComEC